VTAGSITFTLSAAVAKTVLSYVWERLWSNIEWGLAEPA